MKYYRLAADQGDAVAQRDLAGIYFHGDGVAQDYTRAAALFKLAADQGEAQMDAVIDPALLGRLAEADKAYVRSVSAGGSPVAILRALQRRLDQIGVVQGSGGDDAALARSGAPRFGPQADAFKRQVSLWRGRRLDHARQLAFQAERDVKRSGSPAEALVSELLIRLARGAAQASR